MSSQIPFLRSGIQSTPFIHRPAFRRPARLLYFPIQFPEQKSLLHPPSLPRQRGDASYNPGYWLIVGNFHEAAKQPRRRVCCEPPSAARTPHHLSPCWCYRPKENLPPSSSYEKPFGDSPTRHTADKPTRWFITSQTTSHSPCWCYRPKANIPQSSSLTNPFCDSPTRHPADTHPVVCDLTNHILSRLLVNSPSRITQKPKFTNHHLMRNNTNKGGG
jgi:hypothetical protein